VTHDTYILIGGILTLINTWMIHRGRQHTKEQIQELHIIINSRMDQMIAGAKREGASEEKESNRKVELIGDQEGRDHMSKNLKPP
jgi:predicted transposase YdaD